MNLETGDDAHRAGIEAGRAAADTLGIAQVGVIHFGLERHLDSPARHPILPDDCLFSAEYTSGYWQGLYTRCEEIVNHVNEHPEMRLPDAK